MRSFAVAALFRALFRAHLHAFFVVLPVALLSRTASAETLQTLQAPVGGGPFALGEGRVACGFSSPPPPGGWTIERDGRRVRPPTDESVVGQTTALRVAPSAAACFQGGTLVELLATAPLPAVDPASVHLHVDDGRLELRGRRLGGMRVEWRAAGRRGVDRCVDPRPVEGPGASGAPAPSPGASAEACSLAVGRSLPADPRAVTLRWAPAGGRAGEDVVTFDASGKRTDGDFRVLEPARLVVASLVPLSAGVEVAGGAARIPLARPEAVGSVDCSPARCELEGGGVRVGHVTQDASMLELRLRLLPRVFLAKGEAFEGAPEISVPVLRCPMAIASGPPMRDVEEGRAVLRLDGRCAQDARRLRFFAGSSSAEVTEVVVEKETAHVVVRLPRLADSEITLRALGAEPGGSLVAIAKSPTRPAPAVRAVLELEGGAPVDFVPTNRPARVRASSPGEDLALSVLPVEGAYAVEAPRAGKPESGAPRVRGTSSAGGFVSLRFAVRARHLPPPLSSVNLARVAEPVQRPIRESSSPAPLVGSARLRPLVELVCVGDEGQPLRVPPGKRTHLSFSEREGCRLVFHRGRLPPEYGAQKLKLDVEVTKVDGSSRPDARVDQPLLLRPGTEPRIAWVRGVAAPFDRVSIRVSHVADDAHYAGGDVLLAAPAAQWSLVMGASRARLYLTTAVPTGLYRVSAPESSGILGLNVGMLGRLTWLDADGTEGILALESGVVGVGLAPVDSSAAGHSLRQVGVVAGLGLGVPLANKGTAAQASINLHAWAEYEVSRAVSGQGEPWGFVFGPSISFGNVGTNL